MDVNILLRGQSNALIFADSGAAQALADKLSAATGATVHLIDSYGSNGDNTIYSGTEFLTQWMNGTQAGDLEQSLLNYVRNQSADIKDNPTLELWMHNESDQKNSSNFSGDWWKTVYEANHAMVEQAFGHSVTTEFVPIRYNWGNIDPIVDGMKAAVADGQSAGIDWSAYDLAKMDWSGTPNTEHMSANDAYVIADALAKDLAPLVSALAGGDSTGPVTGPVDPEPVALSAGTGADALVLKISQDAYQGDAHYTVSVDGQQIGGTFAAAASHAAGQSDTLTLKGDWAAGEHQVAVHFLDDAWGGTAATDRNLYVDGAAFNGQNVAGAAQALLTDTAPGGFAFTEAGTVAPPSDPLTAGTGADALVLKISQDAYQGDAHYTVSVDGQQIGGTFTAAASHAAGQSDTLTLKGDWAAGEHQVAVRFLDDAWGGTAATDRNLYVDGAAFNGRDVAGAAQAILSDWQDGGFAFTEAGTAPAPVFTGTAGADLFDATPAGGSFTGGAGRDLFVFDAGDGHSTVADFASGTDKLVLIGFTAADVAEAQATEGGHAGLLVTFGDGAAHGGSVFLQGVAALADKDAIFT